MYRWDTGKLPPPTKLRVVIVAGVRCRLWGRKFSDLRRSITTSKIGQGLPLIRHAGAAFRVVEDVDAFLGLHQERLFVVGDMQPGSSKCRLRFPASQNAFACRSDFRLRVARRRFRFSNRRSCFFWSAAAMVGPPASKNSIL